MGKKRAERSKILENVDIVQINWEIEEDVNGFWVFLTSMKQQHNIFVFIVHTIF